MSSEYIRKLSEDNFEKDIESGVTLVDFYADWCGPCRMLAPVLEKVAKELHGDATIAKLDIDHAQRIASSFQVTSVPTLILFKEGKEIGRLVGLRDAETVKDFIFSASKT
jgi:thioredoxin 1